MVGIVTDYGTNSKNGKATPVSGGPFWTKTMEFTVTEFETFTVVTAAITAPDGVLNPSDLASLVLPQCPGQVAAHKGVILDGRMPLWVAAHLTHEYHAGAWIGVNSPRDGGAVVVSRHTPNAPQIGEVVPLPKA